VSGLRSGSKTAHFGLSAIRGGSDRLDAGFRLVDAEQLIVIRLSDSAI